ncbi:hypothetical protein A3Q56_07722, partial [Intoshia linei]
EMTCSINWRQSVYFMRYSDVLNQSDTILYCAFYGTWYLRFNLGYLLWGYYAYYSISYDITWTMSQCIICLRLIGLSWDLYDKRMYAASLKNNKIVINEKFTSYRLTEIPSFMSVMGYSYFLSSSFAGPQFPYIFYESLIKQINIKNIKENYQKCYNYAIQRIALGFVIMIIVFLFGRIMNDQFFISDTYKEASLVLTGITYIKNKETNEITWDCLKNVDVQNFLLSVNVDDVVQSFNIRTNIWALRYVYTRLRFLNNKNISQFVTLLFLAMWHGSHFGYFNAFFLEFLLSLSQKN